MFTATASIQALKLAITIAILWCRADSASASGSAPTGSGSLRVRAYLPAVCLVAAIHEAAQPPAPPGHGYSYVAADLGMEPAAAALVVQGLGRLQQQLALCEVQVGEGWPVCIACVKRSSALCSLAVAWAPWLLPVIPRCVAWALRHSIAGRSAALPPANLPTLRTL